MSEEISKNFVFVIDGEAVHNMTVRIRENMPNGIKQNQEKFVAVMQSSPIIIETVEKIQEGSIWDGNSFIPPVE